jgi:hypothetical protein
MKRVILKGTTAQAYMFGELVGRAVLRRLDRRATARTE